MHVAKTEYAFCSKFLHQTDWTNFISPAYRFKWHLPINVSSSLDPNQTQQNVGPDLDPNSLTLVLQDGIPD